MPVSRSDCPPPGRAEQITTRIAYLVLGVGVSSWAALVPYAKARLGLDEAVLGMLLLCVGVGSLLSMPFTGLITNAARDLAQFSARFGTPLTCASIVLAHCMQRARRKISRLSAFRLSELHAYSRYHFWASCSGTSPYSPLSDSKSQIPLFNFFARPI